MKSVPKAIMTMEINMIVDFFFILNPFIDKKAALKGAADIHAGLYRSHTICATWVPLIPFPIASNTRE